MDGNNESISDSYRRELSLRYKTEYDAIVAELAKIGVNVDVWAMPNPLAALTIAENAREMFSGRPLPARPTQRVSVVYGNYPGESETVLGWNRINPDTHDVEIGFSSEQYGAQMESHERTIATIARSAGSERGGEVWRELNLSLLYDLTFTFDHEDGHAEKAIIMDSDSERDGFLERQSRRFGGGPPFARINERVRRRAGEKLTFYAALGNDEIEAEALAICRAVGKRSDFVVSDLAREIAGDLSESFLRAHASLGQSREEWPTGKIQIDYRPLTLVASEIRPELRYVAFADKTLARIWQRELVKGVGVVAEEIASPLVWQQIGEKLYIGSPTTGETVYKSPSPIQVTETVESPRPFGSITDAHIELGPVGSHFELASKAMTAQARGEEIIRIGKRVGIEMHPTKERPLRIHCAQPEYSDDFRRDGRIDAEDVLVWTSSGDCIHFAPGEGRIRSLKKQTREFQRLTGKTDVQMNLTARNPPDQTIVIGEPVRVRQKDDRLLSLPELGEVTRVVRISRHRFSGKSLESIAEDPELIAATESFVGRWAAAAAAPALDKPTDIARFTGGTLLGNAAQVELGLSNL